MIVANNFKVIIQEVLNRSRAGVFAHLSDDGSIYPSWKVNAEWPLTLGLANRLQQEAYANVVKDDEGVKSSTEQEVKQLPPLAEGQDLSLVPTDALIIELYRSPGQWVLGLCRDRKVERKTKWEGVLWNGSGTTCMGLAALLQRSICDQVAKRFDELNGHDPLVLLERRSVEVLAPMLNESKHDPLTASGLYAFMAYEAYRLREPTSRVGNTLDDFLNGPQQSIDDV